MPGVKRFVSIVLLSGGLFAEVQKRPERTARKNVITSERNPKIRIDPPKEARHVGRNDGTYTGGPIVSFTFGWRPEKTKRWNRVYWVQFEAFLPSKPRATVLHSVRILSLLSYVHGQADSQCG